MIRILTAAALLFCASFHLAAQTEMIVIDKQARSSNPTLRFDGLSGDAQVNQIVRNNLILCGWFDVIRSNNTDYVISGKASGNSVTLRIANSAGQEIATVTANGSNAGETARRGVDRILKELFNIPGICQSRIVFTVETGRSRKEIAVCNFDGTDLKVLTKNRTLSIDPVWTPDGKTVIYSYFGPSYTHLVQIDTTSGLSRRITRYSGINAGGAVSPDGKKVAMILNLDNRVDLYVRDLEGGSLRRLTRDKAVEASPCWSPDGKQICFVSDATGRPNLYLVNPTGGRSRRIPGLAGSEKVAPDWSADNKISYSAKIGRDYVVAVVDMTSGTPRMMTSAANAAPVAGEGPSWAPDNRHTAVEDNGKIYIVDTWLGKKRALFQGRTRAGQPDWSTLLK